MDKRANYLALVHQIPNSPIFTIGNLTLSKTQVEVLSLGLNFIPTQNPPNENSTEIVDMGNKIDRLIRRLIIAENPNLRANPQVPRYSFTTNFIETLSKKHEEILKDSKPKTNLTPFQMKTLKNLRKDPSIIVKPVDKNLGIAIVDKKLYIKLAQVHLGDSTTYRKLPLSPLTHTINHINHTLGNLHKNSLLNKTQVQRLTPNRTTTPGTFYILPKLHKGTLESRPIISNVNHPTKKISQFLHQTMKTTAEAAKSYIKNSTELTHHFKDITVTPSMFIITADIKSLYTLIPNDEGIKNVVKEMQGKTKLPSKTLETLLTLVLNNNIFQFGKENYIQTSGTAMGTIMAPTYANVYLKSKEEHTLLNPSLNPHYNNIKLFKRYIDDILIIYDNHENNMVDFIKLLKKAYEPLELTIKIGKQNQVFLDTEISLGLSKISTQLYVKPLQNKTYIPPSSQHPAHMLKNIIFNDLLRANRLCSEPEQRNKHELNIISKALKAGYDKKSLINERKKARKKASKSNQNPDPNSNPNPAESKTVLTLTYNNESTEKLAAATKELWKNTANPGQQLMIAYKTHDNVKQLTIRSKLYTDR
jgi:hypothetical protein